MRIVWIAIVILGVSAHAETKKRGFWCWKHQDGKSAVCAPEEEQCKASLAGFNQTAAALKDTPVAGDCTWQKSVWELVMKEPPKLPRYFPTKKMCTSGLSKGERCVERR